MYSNVPAKARIRPGQYARNCIRQRNVRASAKLNDSSPPFGPRLQNNAFPSGGTVRLGS